MRTLASTAGRCRARSGRCCARRRAPSIVPKLSPRALTAGDRKRQRGAGEERERRLNQVVQRAALPRHVRRVERDDRPERLSGKAACSVQSCIASASIRNITKPRNASMDSTRFRSPRRAAGAGGAGACGEAATGTAAGATSAGASVLIDADSTAHGSGVLTVPRVQEFQRSLTPATRELRSAGLEGWSTVALAEANAGYQFFPLTTYGKPAYAPPIERLWENAAWESPTRPHCCREPSIC